MTETIELFNNEAFGNLRIVEDEGRVMFCGKDIAEALKYANTKDALSRHCKGVVKYYPLQTDGGVQQARFITEGDVLRLIVSSKLPKAQEYERWVFDEVLPAIHRDGAYVASDGTEDDMLLMARALKAADRSMKKKDAMIAELRPKALVADAVFAPSKTLYTVTEAARYMADIVPGVKREDLFDLLKSTGMMCRRGTAPTRAGIDTGRMVAVADEFTDRDGERRAGEQRGKLTPKGVAFCIERLAAGEVA
ncbi:MAG: phage antirepressor [Slackia sp.]